MAERYKVAEPRNWEVHLDSIRNSFARDRVITSLINEAERSRSELGGNIIAIRESRLTPIRTKKYSGRSIETFMSTLNTGLQQFQKNLCFVPKSRLRDDVTREVPPNSWILVEDEDTYDVMSRISGGGKITVGCFNYSPFISYTGNPPKPDGIYARLVDRVLEIHNGRLPKGNQNTIAQANHNINKKQPKKLDIEWVNIRTSELRLPNLVCHSNGEPPVCDILFGGLQSPKRIERWRFVGLSYLVPLYFVAKTSSSVGHPTNIHDSPVNIAHIAGAVDDEIFTSLFCVDRKKMAPSGQGWHAVLDDVLNSPGFEEEYHKVAIADAVSLKKYLATPGSRKSELHVFPTPIYMCAMGAIVDKAQDHFASWCDRMFKRSLGLRAGFGRSGNYTPNVQRRYSTLALRYGTGIGVF